MAKYQPHLGGLARARLEPLDAYVDVRALSPGCARAWATTAPAWAGEPALQAYTAGGHLSADGVYVETKNQGGGLTDGPFDLAVDCGAPGWYYAATGYAANLVRATPGTTLTHLSAGRYDVTLPVNISSCADLATVGDPGHNLVFNPAC